MPTRHAARRLPADVAPNLHPDDLALLGSLPEDSADLSVEQVRAVRSLLRREGIGPAELLLRPLLAKADGIEAEAQPLTGTSSTSGSGSPSS